MSKNIEININTNGSSYEALYPKTLAGNVQAGTFSGSFTFSSPPSCSTNPSSTSHLVNKSYADSVVNGYATQSWTQQQISQSLSNLVNILALKTTTGQYQGNGTTNLTISVPGNTILLGFSYVSLNAFPDYKVMSGSAYQSGTYGTNYAFFANNEELGILVAYNDSASSRIDLIARYGQVNLTGRSNNVTVFNQSGRYYNYIAWYY